MTANCPVYYCSYCIEEYEEQNKAISFCQDCQFPLCDDHVRLHKKAKKTKDHSLLPIEKVPQDLLSDSSKKLLPTCSKHKGERLKYVCECGVILCRDCAVIEHEEHKKLHIDLVAKGERDRLKQIVMETHKEVIQVDKSLKEVIEMMERIEKRYECECEKIERAGKELKDNIDQRIALLINDMKQRKNSKQSNLEQQKQHLLEIASKVKMNDLEVIERSDDALLLQLKMEMEQKHKGLQKMIRTPVPIEHKDTFEIYFENESILSNIQRWGHVSDSGLINVEKCRISGLQNTLFVNTSTSFTIQLKTQDGTIAHSSIKPKILIIDPEQQEVAYDMDFIEKDSVFKVSFTPRTEGTYKVHVTVGNKCLKNSPFSVQTFLPSPSPGPVLKFIKKLGSEGSEIGQFNCPFFVASDLKGDIYVSDQKNQRIQMFSKDEKWISFNGPFIGGTGKPFHPSGIAFNSRNYMIVADEKKNLVYIFDENKQLIKSIGSKGFENVQFCSPHGVSVDADDNIYLADSDNHRIQIFDKDGTWKKTIGRKGKGEGQFDSPWGVFVCKRDGRIFISDTGNNRIQVLDLNGQFLFKIGSEGCNTGHFYGPQGLVVTDRDEYLLVCDWGNSRIQVFNALNGSFINSYGTKGSGNDEFNGPYGICISPSEKVIVSECPLFSDQHRIQIFDVWYSLQNFL